jgi:hypothetical protein
VSMLVDGIASFAVERDFGYSRTIVPWNGAAILSNDTSLYITGSCIGRTFRLTSVLKHCRKATMWRLIGLIE